MQGGLDKGFVLLLQRDHCHSQTIVCIKVGSTFRYKGYIGKLPKRVALSTVHEKGKFIEVIIKIKGVLVRDHLCTLLQASTCVTLP